MKYKKPIILKKEKPAEKQEKAKLLKWDGCGMCKVFR